MRRRLVMLCLMLVCAATSRAETHTSIGINVNLGNAPPPPVVVYREEPRMAVVPGAAVWMVNDDRCDYDFFRYGVYWYIYNDGYWYRGRGYSGPFVTIASTRVPTAIIRVPAQRWKHHPHGGPPGLVRHEREREREVVVVRERHGRGRGHGRHGD